MRRSSSRSNSSRASSSLPCSASTSASQNEHGRKTPSPARQPVDVAVRRACGSGARARRRVSSRRIASTVETNRSSVAGRKPTSGISRTLASSSSESYDCANACFALAPRRGRAPRRGSRRGSRASARPAPRARTPRASRTARSNATQAITFECVKWRVGPRTSQMPGVLAGASRPRASRAACVSATRRCRRRAPRARAVW